MAVRHKCFISYHHDDQGAVDDFVTKFEGAFMRRGLAMSGDIVNSDDTDYVMQRIRKLYLEDSAVTIALIGRCTWARRFVDWEVQASLRRPRNGPPPNGVLAIQLWESYTTLPDRVKLNVDSGYAMFYKFPSTTTSLSNMVDKAFDARTEKADLISNPRDRFKYNKQC